MRITIFLLFIILFFYGIVIAKNFLSPIVLAGLFCYLILPLVKFFDRHHFYRGLSILLSILIFLGIITIVLVVIYRNLEVLIGDFPSLKAQAHVNIDKLGKFIEASFNVSVAEQKQFIKDSVNNIFRAGNSFTNSIFAGTTSTIFKMGIIPVFMFYLLMYRDHIFESIQKAIPERRKEAVNSIIKRITFVIPRYVGGVFTVVLILSFLNSFGLHLIGVQHAIIFGVISAIFSFIPYFGNWIGASIPFTFALLTGNTPNLALSVLLLFVVIQFIENNILTPNITGSYVHLNPLATIFSLIIGGIVWGIVGMFVVVPIVAILKIIFEHFDSTKPIAYLISTKVQHKPMWYVKMQEKLTLKRIKKNKDF